MMLLLKRPSLVFFGMLAVAIGGVLAWTLSRGPRFSEEHCRLIRVGMTRSEVEQILGKPPNPMRRMNRVSCNMTQLKFGLTQWLRACEKLLFPGKQSPRQLSTAGAGR